MCEVLETAWGKLVETLSSAPDLDALIAAHDRYLETITDKARHRRVTAM